MIFNLDKAFHDSDNDLLVSITSQLGGLPKQTLKDLCFLTFIRNCFSSAEAYT
jgi:hypothetical protein